MQTLPIERLRPGRGAPAGPRVRRDQPRLAFETRNERPEVRLRRSAPARGHAGDGPVAVVAQAGRIGEQARLGQVERPLDVAGADQREDEVGRDPVGCGRVPELVLEPRGVVGEQDGEARGGGGAGQQDRDPGAAQHPPPERAKQRLPARCAAHGLRPGPHRQRPHAERAQVAVPRRREGQPQRLVVHQPQRRGEAHQEPEKREQQRRSATRPEAGGGQEDAGSREQGAPGQGIGRGHLPGVEAEGGDAGHEGQVEVHPGGPGRQQDPLEEGEVVEDRVGQPGVDEPLEERRPEQERLQRGETRGEPAGEGIAPPAVQEEQQHRRHDHGRLAEDPQQSEQGRPGDAAPPRDRSRDRYRPVGTRREGTQPQPRRQQEEEGGEVVLAAHHEADRLHGAGVHRPGQGHEEGGGRPEAGEQSPCQQGVAEMESQVRAVEAGRPERPPEPALDPERGVEHREPVHLDPGDLRSLGAQGAGMQPQRPQPVQADQAGVRLDELVVVPRKSAVEQGGRVGRENRGEQEEAEARAPIEPRLRHRRSGNAWVRVG